MFQNISLLILLNALIKPVWVLTENSVQNAVGHEDWGTYSAMYAFAFLFIFMADFGVNQYATRELAHQPQLLKSYFPNLLTTKVLFNLAYPLLILGIGAGIMGFKGRELYFLGLLCLVHGTNHLIQFFRSNFQAMQAFRIDGFASVVDKVLLLLWVWGLFYAGLSIERFIYARLLTSIATALLFYGAIVKLYGWMRPRFEWKLVKKLLRASFPFALITVLYSIHDKVDQVMLKELAGEVETSLYAAAYRWMDAFSMYLWLVLTMLFAKFAFHKGQEDAQGELLRMGQLITALPLIFVCAFVFFYGDKLLWQQVDSTPAQLRVMEQSLKVLFMGMFVNSLLVIYSTILTATGHEGFVNGLIVVGIAVNVSLNFVFIPLYGAIAAAWATTGSLALVGGVYVIYVQLRLSVAVPYGLIGRILLASMGLLLGFYALDQTSLSWWINTLLAGGLFSGLCAVLGLIPKDLIGMLKRDE